MLSRFGGKAGEWLLGAVEKEIVSSPLSFAPEANKKVIALLLQPLLYILHY